MNNISKYSRGQVWFIDKFNNSIGNEQDKSRPWLIVSGNKNNYSSNIIQIVPITTRNPDKYPFHVYYQYDNRNQVIECEQTTCISTDRLSDSRYMYTLDEYLMDKVDKALMIHFGISYKYSRLFNEFNDMINSTLSGILSDFPSDKISSEELIKFIRNFNDSVESDKSKSNKWTTESMRSYLKDSESMSPAELATKYNLKNGGVANQYKYKFIRILSQEVQDE